MVPNDCDCKITNSLHHPLTLYWKLYQPLKYSKFTFLTNYMAKYLNFVGNDLNTYSFHGLFMNSTIIAMIDESSEPTKDELIRDRLLSIAMQEFMQFGFSRISMDDLADRLGMSKKTLYKYFQSKEVLVREVIELRKVRIGELMKFIEMKVPKHAFGDKIIQVSQKVAEVLSEIRPHVLHDLKRTFPVIFDEYETFRKANIIKGFTAALNEGRASGVFRDDIPIEIAVHVHLTLISAMLHPEYLSNQQYSPLQVFQMILKCTLEGLCTSKGRSIVESSLFTK